MSVEDPVEQDHRKAGDDLDQIGTLVEFSPRRAALGHVEFKHVRFEGRDEDPRRKIRDHLAHLPPSLPRLPHSESCSACLADAFWMLVTLLSDESRAPLLQEAAHRFLHVWTVEHFHLGIDLQILTLAQ